MPNLTARQSSILGLIASGRTNLQIAQELGISENGVKGHVARLLDKFNVRSRAALVAAAQQQPSATAADELVRLLETSLEEVIGAKAASIVLKRARKRAGIADWQTATQPGQSAESVAPIMRELWSLLVEMTGDVVVKRLEANGLSREGAVAQIGGPANA